MTPKLHNHLYGDFGFLPLSIQWLSRNRKHMDEEPDLIVVDEAHHALAETDRILWGKYPEARKLGMTATPCRLNGKVWYPNEGALKASVLMSGQGNQQAEITRIITFILFGKHDEKP